MRKNHKHDWQYKQFGNGLFVVLCAECGKEDGRTFQRAEAERRRVALRAMASGSIGFNRAMRKARAAR